MSIIKSANACKHIFVCWCAVLQYCGKAFKISINCSYSGAVVIMACQHEDNEFIQEKI